MNFKSMAVIMMLGWISTATIAQDKWERMINLQGRWKFSIGDKSLWSEKYFNDNKWEEIFVPSNWEDEGFNGYNGYAWYRKSFDGQDITTKDGLTLSLGYIDDVDEVFFNGHKIGGSGGFPPRFHTAYNALRNYFIPKEYIDYTGRNVIAVRVYDSEIEGGIVSGNIGIYTNKSDRGLAVNLRGVWDFKLTDSRMILFSSIDEKTLATIGKDGWETITVPGHWENQGYSNYDGSAWYRKTFMIPKDMQGEDLVLLLGKIDDSDKTFLNGKLIGSSFDSYTKLRIYHIPPGAFKAGEQNTMIVYIDDPQGAGGIYEGPVGIMKQSEFTRYIRWK